MPESHPRSNSLPSVKQALSMSRRISDLLSAGQWSVLWGERLAGIAKPRILISLFLASSAFYCFVIGRDRYTSVSEFVIQRAAPLQGASASFLAGSPTAPPKVLASIVDVHNLQVYPKSEEIKNRCSLMARSSNRHTAPCFPTCGLDCMPIAPHQHSLIFTENNCMSPLSL